MTRCDESVTRVTRSMTRSVTRIKEERAKKKRKQKRTKQSGLIFTKDKY